MKWKTHQAIGVASGGLLNTFNYSLSSVVALIVIIATSTLPDVDYMLGTKHRGFTHSLLCLGLVSFIGYLINPILFYPIVIGYGSHLLADSFTKSGIELFYPYKKMCGFKLIKTGSREDLFICLVCIGYLFYRYWT